jgi:NTP pyrophosphatase (non-canonical NTP hydrolase)
MTTVHERAQEVSKIALDHGWDPPTWDNFLAKLMLISTEIQEAEDEKDSLIDVSMELADVVIRSLDVLYTLDPTLLVVRRNEMAEEDIFRGVRRRLVKAAEHYRRGADRDALVSLWTVVHAVEAWCQKRDVDIWIAVDLKMDVNRTRPRLHGKKRSVG